MDAQLSRKLETILFLSQKSCESWTQTPSRDLRVPLQCKGGCLQPRVASWQHNVQPIPSGCGVVLLEASREGVSLGPHSIRFMAAEKCYVLSAMGKSPLMVVPKAFTCNVPGRNYSSLLEFTQVFKPLVYNGREGEVPHFLILIEPRQEPGTSSPVCTSCTEFSWLCSRQALSHGTAVVEWLTRPWPALELLEKAARSLNSCFLPDFGVTLTLWLLPICWARLQLCLWLAAFPTDPYPNCWLHVPLSLMPASSPWTCLMVWTPDWTWWLSPDLLGSFAAMLYLS